MKRILIANNNMKVGGVQKSLYNLLWALSGRYEVTLLLFSCTGEYLKDLPADVKVVGCDSLFRYLGVSQQECSGLWRDWLMRGFLAEMCRILGRPAVMKLILASQKPVPGEFDTAISFLHNGGPKSFYGGVNEFVGYKVNARQKIAFLHGDYQNCGANHPANNQLYARFDGIAACAEGCRQAFVKAMPELASRTVTIRNFHRYDQIRILAQERPVSYQNGPIHILMVSRLSPEKAIHRGIRGVSHCRKQGLDLVLHIVGGGKMRAALEAEAISQGMQDWVHFYGEQSNPYRFMKNADLLLITSFHEAAPMIVEEAMCLGLPTLTVKTASSEELVAMRKAGWVCDNDQQSLNERLYGICRERNRLEEGKLALKNRIMDNREAMESWENLMERTWEGL